MTGRYPYLRAHQQKVCVQVSDDVGKWTFFDISKQSLAGKMAFDKANAAANGSVTHTKSPLAAVQFLLAKMRVKHGPRPRLPGVFPESNIARALGHVGTLFRDLHG